MLCGWMIPLGISVNHQFPSLSLGLINTTCVWGLPVSKVKYRQLLSKQLNSVTYPMTLPLLQLGLQLLTLAAHARARVIVLGLCVCVCVCVCLSVCLSTVFSTTTAGLSFKRGYVLR